MIAPAPVLLGFALVAVAAQTPVRVNPQFSLIPGPVNGAVIEAEGRRLLVYGDPTGDLPASEILLLTHGRRDVVWAAVSPVAQGAEAFVPAGDLEAFTEADAFWSEFGEARFHDYAQQSTKLPIEPLPVHRAVSGGDRLYWRGLEFRVLDTPGYTRGAVSYSAEIAGQSVCFVGDLIYGDGRLLDLYSLQDEVELAGIRGYHGYAGRMAELIESLGRVLAEKPDLLVPSRGPVVHRPAQMVRALIGRLRAVYRNYLSINAGRWYFGDRYDVLAGRVLGEEAEVDWMPWAERIVESPPDWILPIQNSRLILSRDGRGFLVDCGSESIVREVVRLRDSGKLTALDGVFITHYHDDHTDAVSSLLEVFPCPVYACAPLTHILERPAAYRLPAMTAHPIRDLTTMPDGGTLRWCEFDFTFYDFPGQTVYHDALLVQRDQGERIFFIGDSFTPSGIDDYCLLNRNLLHESAGYFYCLDLLTRLPMNTLLINQHVLEPFAFSRDQVTLMVDALERRRALLAQLFPWDDPNYGIDERWVRFFPYARRVRAGEPFELSLRIFNHSPVPREFSLTVASSQDIEIGPDPKRLTVPARMEKAVTFQARVPGAVKPGSRVVTVNVAFDQHELRHWTEGLIEVISAGPPGP